MDAKGDDSNFQSCLTNALIRPIFLCTMELGGGHAMVLYGVDTKFEKLVLTDPYGKSSYAETQYFTMDKFKSTIQPVDYAVQCF